ncbi:MAG: DUF58 domain-containing protein [Cyclobacteriaceae bacterium]
MKLDLNKVKAFGNIELLAKQMVEGFITGLHKSPYHGFSVEFAEHRLYNPGESTRHIDWKVFARTDRLYTKRYEEETNLRCYLILDQSSSMYYPADSKAKIKFATMAAGALAYLLHKQRDAVGLYTFSTGIDTQTEVKSTSTHIHKLFLELQNVLNSEAKEQKTNVASTLNEIAQKIHRRSLVIIFSDMFQDREDMTDILVALQHLKHKKHEILMFHITDKKTELDFDFEDRPYEFYDLEEGTKLKVTPSEIKSNYKATMNEYYSELRLKCGMLKIDFIEADVNDDFDTIFSSYLIKRSRMA